MINHHWVFRLLKVRATKKGIYPQPLILGQVDILGGEGIPRLDFFG